MVREELLHSSLYDPAKWRESLIYTEQAPPFPADPVSSLVKFVKVFCRQIFQPMKCSHCWPGLAIFTCQSFSSFFFLFPPPQTCDGLVWPTSAPDTGESFPHFQWTCFQMLLASWTAHDKKISHLRPDRRLLNAPWKRTAGWRCSLPPSTWRTFRKQSSNVEVAQWWRDHTTTGWNITLQ